MKDPAPSDPVYNVVELIGSSENSWEEAAKNAVAMAAQSLEDLRVAAVVDMDMRLDGITQEVVAFRTKVRLSFRYHTED